MPKKYTYIAVVIIIALLLIWAVYMYYEKQLDAIERNLVPNPT
jgi:hypothetical protein